MGLRIVGLSGSVSRPSRTTALVARVLADIASADDYETGGYVTSLIELIDAAPLLFNALTRKALNGRAAEIVETVEQADLLIVGTPVYRASYTGALKHLFDLVNHEYFPGKPVLLVATGGTPLHGLVTEHQLRPLFGFLNALTLPTTVYAVEQDFDGYTLINPNIIARTRRAATEALAQLNARRVPAAVAAE